MYGASNPPVRENCLMKYDLTFLDHQRGTAISRITPAWQFQRSLYVCRNLRDSSPIGRNLDSRKEVFKFWAF
jgi:hypothetical protein